MQVKTTILTICVISSAISLVTSCSKDVQGVADNTLQFVAGWLPQTMAPIESDDDGLITSGTVTGIQILQGEYGSTPNFNVGGITGAVATVATLDGTGVLTCTPTLTINTDGSTANFLAFYPLGTLVLGSGTTPAKVIYTIDGQTDIIAANRVSKTYSPSDNKVNLAFKHQLARLRLRCVCEDDAGGALYQSISEAKIFVPKSAVMTITDKGIITTDIDPSLDLEQISSYTELNFGTCGISQTGEFATGDLLVLPGLAADKIIRNMKISLKFAGFPEEAAREYDLGTLSLVAGMTTTITVTIHEDPS